MIEVSEVLFSVLCKGTSSAFAGEPTEQDPQPTEQDPQPPAAVTPMPHPTEQVPEQNEEEPEPTDTPLIVELPIQETPPTPQHALVIVPSPPGIEILDDDLLSTSDVIIMETPPTKKAAPKNQRTVM